MDRDDAELLHKLASQLLADVERVADDVSTRVLARHPALGHVEGRILHRSTRANVGAFLSSLAYGVPADSIDPPEGALDLVENVASDPNGLPVLLRAYRLGATETWHLYRFGACRAYVLSRGRERIR